MSNPNELQIITKIDNALGRMTTEVEICGFSLSQFADLFGDLESAH